MNNKLSILVWPSLLAGIIFFSNDHQPGQGVPGEPAIAFPGAEGYGKFTSGGRGGKTFIVSNLEDGGPGSLRDALKGKEKKIIVFATSGTIHLRSRLSINANTTIAGQSAPGDGICLADYPVVLGGDNIMVRYMRFRMGDKNQRGGMVDGNGSDDAFGGVRRKNIIIDHCTMSWSTDEVFSVYQGDSTTLQWNMISEPLNYSYHFETGDKDYEHHGYGGIWGGRHLSGHHNLFAHCTSRTPRFDGNRNQSGEFVDFRNNVIYNWSTNNVYAGEGGSYNIINNYYKPGPSTKPSVKTRIANPFKNDLLPYGKYFILGNHVEGAPLISSNNWLGVTMDKGTQADTALSKLTEPLHAEPVSTHDATDAYELVLKTVGASLPKRDTLDQRVINDVVNGTGKIIDVQGGYEHGTAYERTVNAWPTLNAAVAPPDTDSDGMPDAWEKDNGLDSKNADDANKISIHRYYTNIEMYLNGLCQASFNITDTYIRESKTRPYIKIANPVLSTGILTKHNIVYSVPGNRNLVADVYYPAKKSAKPRPAVVMIFGGGWKSGDKSHNIPIARYLASKGYVVMSIEYRLSGEAKYPAAVHDIKAAVRWLRAKAGLYQLDKMKIATLGMSAGGQLAALTGTTNGIAKFEGKGGHPEQSSNVQAIVNIDGLLAFHHPESGEGKSASEFLGGSYEENPANWEEASALNHTDKNTPPILFINSSIPRFHAGRDDMIMKLDQFKIYHETYTMPDSPHPFWFFHPWFDPTVNHITKFLDKVFKRNT
ncbi:alpha/beta hydrolase fold domain-containing protein [Flavitalea antarctica]